MTKYQPDMRVSEYLLSECIGAGAFCEVWRARHHVWPTDEVAVKLPIEPEYVRYLRREGAVVHGLRHPNIVRVIGMDPYAETPYLTMELVKGPSLRQVVGENRQGLPVPVVGTILKGVLRALHTAHTAGVLHRDIKPGNVMLHLDSKPLNGLAVDQVKVGDFGLGYGETDALRSIAQSASINRDDALVGTLAYMAPELRDGAKKADARSDLYSVGVVLFELLTGERPAGAELPGSIRSGIPAYLDDVFNRLYARYDRRYESAQAALDALQRFGGAAQPPPIPAPGLGYGRRSASGDLPRVPPSIGAGASRCPSCQRPVETGDQFCVHCGSQVRGELRRCSKCNGFPAPDDRFCIFCGNGLEPAAA